MPPIVSIIGKSESGKTTFIEKLIAELKSRSYRVATIKHTPQGAAFGESDKDSWRHIQAGSDATAISSPNWIALIKPTMRDATLDEIALIFGEDYDIIITEGFKKDDASKIEVHRKESGPPLDNIKKLIAIATDEPLDTDIRQFSLQDAKGLADFLGECLITPPRK